MQSPIRSRQSSVLIRAILVFVALSRPLLAAPCPAVEIRNPDGNYIIPGVQGDIAYAGNLALDAYVQRGERARPSVIVIHGGTWSSGSRVAHVGQILEVLTRAGYHWFSVDYRLAGVGHYEKSVEDVRAALSFIRCRAREFGIDPNQLVLLGEDSGAHLAALLAAERPAGVIGAVLLGGFYDLTLWPGAARELGVEGLDRASPLRRIVPRMPALLVVHGGADTEAPVDAARRFCAGVIQAEGRCRFIQAERASHRIENWWPSQWGYKQEMVEWLRALTPRPPPPHQPRPGAIQKEIVYRRSPRLTLDAFIPPASAPVPAVILVHGGGWEAGDKVTYVTPLFEPLARAGLAWFSIDYRLTPEYRHEDQLDDVRQAVRFVRAAHARFNIDPARIVLLGESASGQMVAHLAAEDRSLAGVISFYGVYDLAAMVTDASPRSLLVRLFRRSILDDDSRALLRSHSPLHRAHKDMPPLLLVNGTGERLWEQARVFAERLTRVGAAHELVRLDGAPHGLENWEGHAEWMFYKRRMVDWIHRIVR